MRWKERDPGLGCSTKRLIEAHKALKDINLVSEVDMAFCPSYPDVYSMAVKNPWHASPTVLLIIARSEVIAPKQCCLLWLALDYAAWLLIHSATYLAVR